ncbi:serine/threonine-protein kinase [Actinomadura sp. DC4]|uniref:serine/threonine-protein kinase n=1 Tax=Actinomadura sp. DC4 TaxID=3055069 RepID=UPI0025B184BC|nr:serine/threonine-protein kinase [Actinomadura sp. DC4]MDN3351451.1 protein kinase [Actinomadura sp. DC4]
MRGETGRLIHGRYRISSRLGRGGMGNVWLAQDERIGRPVALKEILLTPDGEDLSVQLERAKREAHAAATIDHPGIVEIHDFFLEEEEQQPWIVMEYIKGRTLADLIAERALTERALARIGVHILDALVAVHDRNVVHRDVKPTNIVINEAGEVFLVDFGIAHLGGRTRLTGALVGTADFLSPERVRNGTPGPPADLWSLGITFFTALERRSPFHRANIPATLYAILNEDPPPAGRPGPFADAVALLLHKDPERRMVAAELAPVLGSIVTGRTSPTTSKDVPAAPHPAVPRPASPRPARRGRPEATTPRTDETVRQAAGATVADDAWQLAGVSPQSARDALARMRPKPAARMLLALPEDRAAAVLAVTPSRAAGSLLDELAAVPVRAASILAMLSATLAGRALNYARRPAPATLIAAMPPAEGARIMARTDIHTAAGVITDLNDPSAACRLVDVLPVAQAGNILGYVEPAAIAALLREGTATRAEHLLRALPHSARAQVRRRLSEDAPAGDEDPSRRS